MNYKLPPLQKIKKKSSLEPYFDRVRGTIIPGAHRLQLLLNDWLEEGILNIPSVLITGSNGKGTTCAFIESIMRKHGFKTGLYTSPHLIHPTERIRINGVPIHEETLEKFLTVAINASKKYLPDASFFELSTATALLVFLDQKIDFLICEVGLGGHYDSTNSLSPLVSVLTTVSLEHTEYLGDTLKKIAADKSFISRRNKPFIVSTTCKEALDGIHETLNCTGAKLIHSTELMPEIFENQLQIIESINSKESSYFAKMNLTNLRTSLCAINQLQNEFQFQLNKVFKINNNLLNKAILNTEWPGRFDIRNIHGRNVIFDASHNPDGFQYFLNEYRQSDFSTTKCVLVFASLNDKDWKTTLSLLPEIAVSIIFTQIPSNRSQLAKDLTNYFNNKSNIDKDNSKTNNKKITCQTIPDFDQALEIAMNKTPDLPLVITGSIAFIGSAMQRFGLDFHRGNE